MDTTIDTLAIEIETETSGSLKSIDTIISKLNKLNTALANSTTAVNKFKTSFAQLNNLHIKDIKAPKMPKMPKSTGTASTKMYKSILDTGSATDISKKTGSFASDKSTASPKSTTEQYKALEKTLAQVESRVQKLEAELAKLKRTGDKASSAGHKIKNSFKGLSGASSAVKKLSASMNKAFSSSLTGSIRKFGLALVGVRSLFTATRSAVQEYMNYDTQLRDTLRNNWAVLGSLIAPVLETVISLFGKAVAYVRAFIQALTGIDLVARANSKSVKSLGDSAKDALGSLAKFDDLNVVEFPKASESDGMKPLTTPDIDTSALDVFIDKIKNGDWYSLGMEIGRMFNEGLRAIDFNFLIDKAQQWAKNFGDLLNGLTDGTDWNLLGEKIAGGINTAFAFVNTFFETYNWDNLGTSVSTGLNSMIDNVNWEAFGQFFANKFVAVFDFLSTAVETFDFTSFGESISTSINSFISSIDFEQAGSSLIDAVAGIFNSIGTALANIDWGGLAKSLSDGISGMLDSAITFFQETDWSQVGQTMYDKIVEFITNVDWASIVTKAFELLGSAVAGAVSLIGTFVDNVLTSIADYFSQYIEEGDDWQETGRNIILGVLEGLANAILNIGTWIYDNILTPFINGFKEAFDIHSPSKVMEEQGGFVWQGFLNAFTNVKEAIKKKWEEVKQGIKEKINEIIEDFKIVFSKKNFENIFNTVKTTITTKFTEIKNNIKTKMSEAWTALTSVFSLTKIGDHFTKVFNKIKSIFKTIGTTVGNVIGDSFANVVNSIIGFAENTINKFIKAINKAINLINEIPGVNISKLKEINIPKLATGTNRIEAEGLYHLHKNEAVVPAKYNPAVNDDLYNNKGVIEALGMVYNAINNLDITNVVNLGNKTLYKETIKYAKNQNQIYGENVVTI